jgi:hypothetical protein
MLLSKDGYCQLQESGIFNLLQIYFCPFDYNRLRAALFSNASREVLNIQ